MRRVEKHVVTPNDKNFKQIDKLCFQSKNLYNYANYIVREEFIKNRKWIRYNDLDLIIKIKNYDLYSSIPNATSQQILMLLDRNWKSFFLAIKAYTRSREKFLGRPKLPKYKDKLKGRNLLIFTSDQIRVKDNYIHFPKKCQLQPIKTNQKRVQNLRVVPFKGVYKIEVVYEKEEIKHENLDKEKYLGIDLGINNLCTLTTNVSNLRPIIVNGKRVKSINQYYNKKASKIQSELKKKNRKNWSHRLDLLNLMHHNKVENGFHHISKFIIEYCVKNGIGNIVIGVNKGWKQEIELGRVTNQKFMYIPYGKLINQIMYKAQLNGIQVKTNEESYTSKCSALDLEPIKKHEYYAGKRVKRGLFKTSTGSLINADVNGSLNILRKVIGDDFINLLDRGLVHNPLKYDFYKTLW